MKVCPVSFKVNQPVQNKKDEGISFKQPTVQPQQPDVFITEKKKTINFGYNHLLKTLWKKGKLPTVIKGFYGGILTKDNCSLEHLQCASKGGKTDLGNLVLATKENNNARGNQPLKDFLNPKHMQEYLQQFVDINVEGLNGNKYIKGIINKVNSLTNKNKKN